MGKYEIDPMSIIEDTERTRFCPQTDRRTDGQGDTSIPRYQLRWSGGYNYISDAENETQQALLGPTNGNIEMCSLLAAAMLTIVAAATIVQFPQCGDM